MSPHRRLSTITALIFALSIANTVQGLAFEGFEVVPTDPAVESPNGYYFEIKPGDTINDSLDIRNTSDKTINVRVYATDTEINNQDQTVLKAYNTKRSDFGNWVSFDGEIEKNFSINPNEAKRINFTVNLPTDKALGKYYGGIMAENLGTEGKELESNVVIKTNARIGLFTKLIATDSPQPVLKQSQVTHSQPPTPWTQIYFYVSLGLFVLVVGGFAVNALLKRKKHRQKHHQQ